MSRRGMNLFAEVFERRKRARVGPLCLEQVDEALEEYRKEVEASRLAPETKRTYMRHAETFVRWLRSDFDPGERV